MAASSPSATMTDVKRPKIKLREVNRHLVCRLCRGYYVDATTIAECLHSFCRSCIIKYLEKNSFCPICEVQIHKTKPYLNLRLDKALQDLVYKLVPGLYQNEMAKRRKFFEDKPEIVPQTTPEQRGVEERLIFSPEDSISLSLEFIDSPEPEPEPISSHSSDSGEDFPLQLGLMKVRRVETRKESTDSNEPGQYPKRFLLCPAGVSISLLKKFLRQKFELPSSMEVEIMHKRIPLADHYTLMDVAYIFTWKRMAPMRLFYQINPKHPLPSKRPPTAKPEASVVSSSVKPVKPVVEPKNNITNKPTSNCPDPKERKTEIPEPKKTDKPVITPPKVDSPQPKPQIVEKPTVNKPKEIKTVQEPLKVNKMPEPKPMNVKPIAPPKPIELKPCTDVKPNVAPKPMVTQKPPTVTDMKPVAQRPPTPFEVKAAPRPPTPKSVPPKPIPQELKHKLPVPQDKKPIPLERINEVKTTLAQKPMQPQVKKPIVQPKPAPSPKIGKHSLPVSVVDLYKPVAKNNDKFLLNPKSGELEVFPLNEKREEKFLINPKSGKLEPASSPNAIDKSKSNVHQLKNFRKEKTVNKDASLTITNKPLKDKIGGAKETASVSIEIKNGPGCEYDFESTSPPKIMSLQEYTQSDLYREKVSKMRNKNEDFKKVNDKESPVVPDDKKSKTVPSLFRINNSEKKPLPKKPEDALQIINIKTPEPKPTNGIKTEQVKRPEGAKTPKRSPESPSDADFLRQLLIRRDAVKAKTENTNAKLPKTPATSKQPLKPPTPIDLNKSEPATPTSGKIPLENLRELSKKPFDNKIVEMLVSIAQKQNIEPLLKVPNFPQNGTTSQSVSPNDISQALEFFQKISSDMKQLEAKAQDEQNGPAKYMTQLQQSYLQQIELVRMLKRQLAGGTDGPMSKLAKVSPSKDENTPKEDMEKTLQQIKEQADIQRKLNAVHHQKNLPNFFQYYTGQTFLRPNVSTSQKPVGLTPDEQHQLMINAGLSSDMSYHEMFQQYLAQQIMMNQRKGVKRSASPNALKSSPPEKKPSPTPSPPKNPEPVKESPKPEDGQKTAT